MPQQLGWSRTLAIYYCIIYLFIHHINKQKTKPAPFYYYFIIFFIFMYFFLIIGEAGCLLGSSSLISFSSFICVFSKVKRKEKGVDGRLFGNNFSVSNVLKKYQKDKKERKNEI